MSRMGGGVNVLKNWLAKGDKNFLHHKCKNHLPLPFLCMTFGQSRSQNYFHSLKLGFRVRKGEYFLFYIQPPKAGAFWNNITKVHSVYVQFNKIRTSFLEWQNKYKFLFYIQTPKASTLATVICLERSTCIWKYLSYWNPFFEC